MLVPWRVGDFQMNSCFSSDANGTYFNIFQWAFGLPLEKQLANLHL